MSGFNQLSVLGKKEISGKTYIKKITQFSFLTGWMGMIAACIVWIGWIIDNEEMKNLFFRNSTLRPLAAVLLFASGAGLLLVHHSRPRFYNRYLYYALLSCLCGLGIVSMVYYLLHPEDTAQGYFFVKLFHLETWPDSYHKVIRLPAPITAAWGFLFGCGLWLSTRTKTELNIFLFQTITHLALMLCLVSLLTYAFEYTVTPFFSVAFHSALVFTFLFVGLLATKPTKYVTAIVLSARQGGIVLRRLFPIVLFLFFGIFSLLLVGQRAGLYDYDTAYVLSAVIGMMVLWYTILKTSVWLQIMDQKQERTEIHLRNTLKKEIFLRQEMESMNQSLEQMNEELAIQEEGLRTSNQELNVALKSLEERNFELDQFVYRTSHDLRSPLTTMLGLTDLMAEEDDMEQMRAYALLVRNRVLKLDEFITTMLSYSRNTRVEVQHQAIDFQSLIEESLAELQLVPNFDEIHKTWNIRGEHSFWSDAFRLKVIFNNIISNSIKYARQEADKQFSIDVYIDAEYAEITFYDNGIGIQQESKAKVFDMFYRATTLSQGSGLGMYIVKQSVERLLGQIYLESEAGIFTEIKIILPNMYVPQQCLVQKESKRVKD